MDHPEVYLLVGLMLRFVFHLLLIKSEPFPIVMDFTSTLLKIFT